MIMRKKAIALPADYDFEPETKMASNDEEDNVRQDYIQWMTSNNRVFIPASKNVKRLTPGFYEIGESMNVGLFFSKIALNTEELIEFPESNIEEVVQEIETFWDKEKNFREAGLSFKRGILMYGPPGCHARGTKILMADGSTKNVEDVEVGDALMGPDSRPRRVLELRRGRDEMYRVTPNKGQAFVVNQHHVLSLEHSGSRDRYPSPVNMQLKNYLELGTPTRQRLKLRRSGPIEFNSKPDILVDPYFLGVWLGDGTATAPEVTTADYEIAEYVKDYAETLGLKTSVNIPSGNNNRSRTYRVSKTSGTNNVLLDRLRELNVIGNKHIPDRYKTSSEQTRLSVLAGIIDTDGAYSSITKRPNDKMDKGGYKGYYDIIQVRERLAKDVLWIARSLGFGTNIRKCEKHIKSSGFKGEYWRISIFGDIARIPVKLPRKQALVGKPNKNPLLTGVKSVEHVGQDEFYGFTLSGDHLYLTDDFMVHHNSGKTSAVKMILNNIVKRGGITVKFDNPGTFTAGMKVLRDIQEDTPVICLMEDLDSILDWNSESRVINVIDGMEGVDRVVFLATTNYPEKLGSRIMNRPSRFDKRIFIGMPNSESRKIYLAKKLNGKKVEGGIQKWVDDTDGMSVAHLKELVVAVTILGKDYGETIGRLREMADKVNSKEWDVFGEGDRFASLDESVSAIIKDAKNIKWVSNNCKFAKKGKPVNPWAVCHTTVDKDEDPEKHERCVQDVKKQHPVRKDTPKKKKASLEKSANTQAIINLLRQKYQTSVKMGNPQPLSRADFADALAQHIPQWAQMSPAEQEQTITELAQASGIPMTGIDPGMSPEEYQQFEQQTLQGRS